MGDKSRRRERNSSSDLEGTRKPPSKMAIAGTSDVIRLLAELKEGQEDIKKSLNKRFDEFRNEITNVIEEKMQKQKSDILEETENKIRDLTNKLYTVECTQKQQLYKSWDHEARQRRNNLIFYNIAEQGGEDVSVVLDDFIKTQLGVTRPVAIQRVHRLGAPKPGKTRPIIVCFRDYPDVEVVLSNSKALQGKRQGISRDIPDPLRKARSNLEADRRKARQDGKRAVIAYPAKLVVDGVVVRDEIPDWSRVRRG